MRVDRSFLTRTARLTFLAAAGLVIIVALASSYAHRVRDHSEQPAAMAQPAHPPSNQHPSATPAPPNRVQLADEDTFFEAAASAAWHQFDRLWNARTGLASATPNYDRLTPWDMGSVLASNYSGYQLGFLTREQYDARMRRTLHTLQTIPLYRGAVFHKMYFADSGRMVSRTGRPTTVGYGWSATDLGRLLNWLRIVAETEPQLRSDAERIVHRIRFSETTGKGYLYGGLLGSHGKLWRFQEGRIGYEQYAAQGFAYWGAAVSNALDPHINARPVNVLGVMVPSDVRGLDRLNSEPFVLMGIELGFTPGMAEFARSVLAAQEARFRQTGTLTMVSEDAVSVPPYYFYYYCVLCNGQAFTVDVAETGKRLDKPRWVSTKASFGYYVLMGTDYTRRVLASIKPAISESGVSSGVFENTTEPTHTYDLNTSAVVLESAAYRKLGKPLLQSSVK